jgi:hypothetical protein
MKKILLTVLFILAIFQMVVLATAIDVGSAAINGDTTSILATLVSRDNTANETGVITSVEIWAETNLANCEVATFDEGASSILTTRDTEAIGSVTADSKQTFVVNLTVSTGDMIGIYFSSGSMDITGDAGAVGTYYLAGDQIPCTGADFSLYGPAPMKRVSLYGTGATPAATTTNIFMGVNF